MPAITLRLSWPTSVEYIVLLDPRGRLSENQVTEEFWREKPVTVAYSALCVAQELKGETLRFSLKYVEGCAFRAHERDAQETRLDPDDLGIHWGITEISLNLETLECSAVWHDDKPETVGVVRARCNATEESDTEDLAELDRETALRLLRPGQASVKRELLAEHERCAISHEGARAVLDLAHIREAKHGGQATRENCFLLRADLHRLFDAKILAITNDGKVVITSDAEELSAYREELRTARLSTPILNRVKSALKARAAS